MNSYMKSLLHEIIFYWFWSWHQVVYTVPDGEEGEAHKEAEGAAELRHEGHEGVHPLLPLSPDLRGAVVVAPEEVARVILLESFIKKPLAFINTHLCLSWSVPILAEEPDWGSPTSWYSL